MPFQLRMRSPFPDERTGGWDGTIRKSSGRVDYPISIIAPPNRPPTSYADLFGALDKTIKELLRHAMSGLHLSACAYDRILKVARTIADRAASDPVTADHISEAIQFRPLDRQT